MDHKSVQGRKVTYPTETIIESRLLVLENLAKIIKSDIYPLLISFIDLNLQ